MTAPAAPEGDSVVFREFKGLNNLVADERLVAGELAAATNVDLDDTGHIRRRRGVTRVATGWFHSLFAAHNGTVYVVKDQILHRLLPTYATVSLGVTIGHDPLAYVQVGDRVYFSSATVSGVIAPDDTVAAWGAVTSEGLWLSPVVNPTSTLHATHGKLLGAPPMATTLAYHNGRIYLGHGSTVWATELYLYHYVDKTRTFLQFESEITLLVSVANGFFVGTAHAVWFLSGPFAEMRRELVLRAGAIPGSAVTLPADAVNPPQFRENGLSQTRPAVLFMTTDGICAGFDSGTCYNLTATHMAFPQAVRAAAMYRDTDGIGQYVAVTETGGTPTSTARIGDYVDAEIRRFQGV